MVPVAVSGDRVCPLLTIALYFKVCTDVLQEKCIVSPFGVSAKHTCV